MPELISKWRIWTQKSRSAIYIFFFLQKTLMPLLYRNIWHSGLMLPGCSAELTARCHSASLSSSRAGINRNYLAVNPHQLLGRQDWFPPLFSEAVRSYKLTGLCPTFTPHDLSHRKTLSSYPLFHLKHNRNMSTLLQSLISYCSTK